MFTPIRRAAPPGRDRILKGLFTDLAELLRQLRQRHGKVGDQPIVGHLEDRGLLILVDRPRSPWVLHAGEMLDRARDRQPRHKAPALPPCRFGRPASRWVHSRHRPAAAGAHRSAQLVGDRLDILGEILATLHGAAAQTMIFAEVSSGRSDFDSSSPTRRTARDRPQVPHHPRRAPIPRHRRLEGRGAHRDDLDLVLRAHLLPALPA